MADTDDTQSVTQSDQRWTLTLMMLETVVLLESQVLVPRLIAKSETCGITFKRLGLNVCHVNCVVSKWLIMEEQLT